MLHTYKAVLQGDHVDWIDAPPTTSRPTPVHITILEESGERTADRGKEMGRILDALARAGGLSAISDPVAWQREVRQDRSLPVRES